VKGWTTQGTDGRTEIVLAPVERDLVLREMRDLLKAVHGVVTGVSDPAQGMQEAERSARAAGMTMAADVDPALMAKLPLPFKQMGMSVHRDMDRLADAIVQKETSTQILARVSSITARCTTCHDLYRFSIAR
jgi:cytochrome c556